MRPHPFLSLVVACTAVLASCGDGEAATEDGRPRVIAAFYPLAEAARRVAGDAVDVVNITPAGTEPHDLELTADQVDDIEDADVVLYVGGGFQPALEEIARRSDDRAVDVLDAIGMADSDDPHFWLDPSSYAKGVDAIAEAMATALPDAASSFSNNAAAYADLLETLDREFERGLERCARRTFVTSHDAFGFLARRYDLQQLSISGLSPESEPDPRRLDELADEIAGEGITTVFYEELASPDVAETLAREVGVDADVLYTLEGLTPKQVDGGQDYLSVMRLNLAALQKALDCS